MQGKLGIFEEFTEQHHQLKNTQRTSPCNKTVQVGNGTEITHVKQQSTVHHASKIKSYCCCLLIFSCFCVLHTTQHTPSEIDVRIDQLLTQFNHYKLL